MARYPSLLHNLVDPLASPRVSPGLSVATQVWTPTDPCESAGAHPAPALGKPSWGQEQIADELWSHRRVMAHHILGGLRHDYRFEAKAA